MNNSFLHLSQCAIQFIKYCFASLMTQSLNFFIDELIKNTQSLMIVFPSTAQTNKHNRISSSHTHYAGLVEKADKYLQENVSKWHYTIIRFFQRNSLFEN